MNILRLCTRLAVMIPAIISVLWPLLNGSGLLMAVLGSWAAIGLANWKLLQRLRTRTIVLATLFFMLSVLLIAHVMLSWTIVPWIFGATGALWLRSIVVGFFATGAFVLGLRLLAKRSGFWFVVELALLALSSVVVFFPHQYKIIMRPLWLSDLAWSVGLEPSLALGIIGATLATILSIITVLERSNRKHPSIILFPFLALLALIFINPLEMETPPPPQRLEDIKNGAQSQSQSDQNGQGGGSGGQGNENDQNMNSGQKEKGGDGEGGQPKPAAVVLLGNDYTPPNEYYYFRQEIQSDFNGVRLMASTDSKIEYEAWRTFPTENSNIEAGPTEYRRRVLADIALLAPHTTPFALEAPFSYVPTKNPRPGRFVRTYRTESWSIDVGFESFLDFQIGNPAWEKEVWEHYTAIPDNPHYEELAKSIIEGLPEKYQDNLMAQAFAVKLFLDKNTKYTMKERHEKAEDPTAEFLFGPHKQFTGYCVHTSHSATYLWRALGIPARIGVGYAVSGEQRRGGAILVMDRDAHSWPELYVEELGWVVMDISPETVLDEAGEPPDLEMLDALEELARAAPDSQFRKAINWAELWATYKPLILKTLLFLFISSLFALYYQKIRRRILYRWQNTAYQQYISALDLLSENGYVREYGESREKFAQRVSNNFPSFLPITWQYLAVVLGGNEPAVIAKTETLKQLDQEIANHIPLWRRLLGLLNPFSPFLSK